MQPVPSPDVELETTTNQHHRAPARCRRDSRRPVERAARLLLAMGLPALAGGLVVLAPAASGTSWGDVGHALHAVGLWWLLGLAAVWIAGLWSYAVVMTASLPGLTTRQALSLNLAGSAVANSLPLGGALSLGLVTAMSRSWGFTRSSITTFLMLTNLWNVLIRLLFGALSVAWFLTAGPGLISGPAAPLVAALAVVVILVLGTMLINQRALAQVGRVAGALVGLARRASHPPDYARALLELRGLMWTRLRTSWVRLTLGMLGYIVLLALLLDVSLRGLGAPQPILLMLAVVGIERLVTALPITPGGAGAAEISLVACLTAAGVSGVDALAATLLYRFFTFIAEFPAGAAMVLEWHLNRSRRAARSPDGGLRRIERIA